MKTRIITLLIAITAIVGSAYAQKKIEVYKNGAVVYSEYVSDIDSVKFVTTEEQSTKTYLSTLNVVTGSPDEIEAGDGNDLGTLTEEVQIEINNSSKTIGLSIKGITLGELANIPSVLQAPFDIELQNVPYTETEGEYNVSYNLAINEEEMTTDVAIGIIEGCKAYLVSLVGSIKGEELQLNIFVFGDKNLIYIPVNIIVNSPIKDNNEGSSNTNNGHAYVDLGLSVKWATCNVGATTPEEYGDYYAWGETITKSSYTSSNYTYSSNSTTLPLFADVARVNWGGSWRMPTRAEQEELIDTNNCTWEWITQNGVKGYKVTSKKNGNSIFLPAAGHFSDSKLYYAGRFGYYWSSSLSAIYNSIYAYDLCFSSSNVFLNNSSSRYYGYPVRAVCP